MYALFQTTPQAMLAVMGAAKVVLVVGVAGAEEVSAVLETAVTAREVEEAVGVVVRTVADGGWVAGGFRRGAWVAKPVARVGGAVELVAARL